MMKKEMDLAALLTGFVRVMLFSVGWSCERILLYFSTTSGDGFLTHRSLLLLETREGEGMVGILVTELRSTVIG
jgi:hypothetical protein